MPFQLAGYATINGTPHINGKPAAACEKAGQGCLCDLIDTLAPWLCPECDAHLARSGICLNACHLTAAQHARFSASLMDAQVKTGRE